MLHVQAADKDNVGQGTDKQDKECNGKNHSYQFFLVCLVFYLVETQLVLNTFHIVGKDDAVDGIVTVHLCTLCFKSLFPSACILVEVDDNLVGIIPYGFPCQL